LAPAPANITADTLQANSKTGRAFYSGHARLWQGESVLEAESIELLRETRVLNAGGNVRAVFPQAVAQAAGDPSSRVEQKSSMLTPATTVTPPAGTKKTHLWHAASGTLTYSDKENRAHLEQNVVVQSAEQRMRAPSLDLYFTRSPSAGQTSSSSAGSAAGACATTGAVSFVCPFECGMIPVIAATRTTEKRVTDIAAIVSSGCSFLMLVSIASFSFRIANGHRVRTRPTRCREHW